MMTALLAGILIGIMGRDLWSGRRGRRYDDHDDDPPPPRASLPPDHRRRFLR
jgi:hypothetical protein